MKLRLLAVGRVKEAYWRDAVAEYAKRLSSYCTLEILEVADEKTPEHAPAAVERKIKETEGERLLARIPERSFVVALAIEGQQLDSEALSAALSEQLLHGVSDITLVIGGSLGLSPEVLARADRKLSFSRLTFPHQLMRVMVLEQLYRAFRIRAGEPYHK